MDVMGFDPALSVEAAWRLPSEVQRMENVQSLVSRSDFISLHLPVLAVHGAHSNQPPILALEMCMNTF